MTIKLNEQQVLDIRAALKEGQGNKHLASFLAKRYNVGQSTIRRIRSGERWKYAGEGFRPGPRRKLTEEDARAIKYSKEPWQDLAERYDICHRHIKSIQRGTSWRKI